jgi:palmitoyl transferase
MRKFSQKVFFLLSALLLTVPAHADNWFTRMGDSISDSWNKAMAGDEEIYLPLITWHNRATYSAEAIASHNERPWGLGYGRDYRDENGNWKGFYAMMFKDSHMNWQPIAGYGSTTDWYSDSGDWHAGLGYTVFLTARQDTRDYLPFPGVLPLVTAGYKRLTLQGTYVPGLRHGTGNVLFIWAKYRL